jgi:predicted GH43/DUF377 family glycosyl hydrolase
MLQVFRKKSYIILTLVTLGTTLLLTSFTNLPQWEFGPFIRIDSSNPILAPTSKSMFYCPIQHKAIRWECENIFNPGAVVRDGKVYLFYRAEDDYGSGIGQHTSRIGLAISHDGVNFKRAQKPVMYPSNDDQYENEFPGGCEDPRVVETDDGTYVMTYTQWNRQIAVLGVATSKDLLKWKKHGYAFEGKWDRIWSKSGSIVCRYEGDHLIATKIKGKYWMYWGEGNVYAAVSDDLISWEPLQKDGVLQAMFETRSGKFDSLLVEAGPPAIITENGILLLYNGKNSIQNGDPKVLDNAYSAGQVLFDINDPTKILNRCDEYFLTPEKSYEMNGQYTGGTVFIEGIVRFKNHWFLYYGTADSAVGVAVTK